MMTISELARSGGVGVETVRFYQRRGLLIDPRPSSQAAITGRRHYGEEDARRLGFIRSAQRAGFTLDEIAELIELDRSGGRARARVMARERIAALDGKISELQAAKRALEGLARACAKSERGACPIIAAFDS